VILTLEQYWMGRDGAYPDECTLSVRRNAAAWLAAANTALKCAADDGVEPGVNKHTGNALASGWRPKGVNAETSNAAHLSTHIYGCGGDIQDQVDRRLARWCLRHLDVLEGLGLYMEDPRWTPSWVHWQIVAPGSGKRVYIPSAAPALALALPEQAAA
jgi:hypothetical protein